MWQIYEHRQLIRTIENVPKEIIKRYEKWKDIIRISGPQGLRLIKGFHDESLKGEWKGYRSSRLGLQYRTLYQVVEQEIFVAVFDITVHDYRKK